MNRVRYGAVVFFVAASVLIQVLIQPPTASAAVDLIADSLTWSPNPANPNDPVDVTFRVRNAGSTSAGTFHVQLKRDGTNSCDWIVNGLGGGQVFQRTCPAWFAIRSATPPGHTMTMIVDDRGEISESSDSNNSLSVFVPVGTPLVATPTITPNGGTFNNAVTVTLATATSGATIRYTTDGSTPTATSPLYSASFALTASATVQAKGFKAGTPDSATASASFTVVSSVATPSISPNGGTFMDQVSVTLATTTPDATLVYTTDGSDPTASSPPYTAPVLLTQSATLKARAFKAGVPDSPVASAAFTIQKAAATLRFTEQTQAKGFVLNPDRGGWHGSFVADYDNDGDEDLFMTSHGIGQADDTGYDALFRNNGAGQFTDVAASAGVQGAAIYGRFTRELHGSAWIDYDNDGDLDLYMPDTDSNVLESGPNRHATDELYENNGTGTFIRVSTARGFPPLGQLDYARRGVVAADFNHDGFTDLFVLQMIQIQLDPSNPYNWTHVIPTPYRSVYFNQAGQSFCLEGGAACPEMTGVGHTGWSQGATSLDYDNDGDVDVLESDEDSGSGLRLWENDGHGHFVNVAAARGLPGAGTEVNCATAGDIDNDGDQDLYVRVNGVGSLYRNNGGQFTLVATFGGAEHMFFADLDNDGDLDLVSGGVYLNNGNGTFGPDQAAGLGLISEGRGGMAFDADGDGDLDIILNRSDRTFPYIRYYVNGLAVTSPSTTRLRVKLTGPQGQAGAPGAKVYVYEAGHLGEPAFLLGYREVTTATGFVSGPSPIQHFGLGGRTTVDVRARFLGVHDQAGNLIEKVVDQPSVQANTTLWIDGR